MYDVAFVMRSNVRKEVLERLSKPRTAKMLSKELNKHIQSISRALLELESKKLAVCNNPKDDRFRFYEITDKGKEVLNSVKNL